MLTSLFAAACLITVGSGSIPAVPAPQPPATAAVAAASSAAGSWSGAIKLPGMELKVQVQLAAASATWSGSIDIPQQAVKGLKLQQIAINGESVSFQIADIPGTPTFSGKLDGADKISGDFSQAGQTFPFELARGELAKAKRPQNPVAPFPYAEEQMKVTHGDVTLAGTLTIPQGKGPFPAVILVSGSGPQNRDEALFEHRPFAVWADYLSRNGIIVLRYDDRGVGESSGDHAAATTSMFADDAQAWVGCLKKRTDVQSVGIMGHSEGGIIAPMVAARNPSVAFIVMLAGTGVSGAEVLIEQNRALAMAGGKSAEEAEKIAVAARAVFKAVADKVDPATLRARMLELVKAQTGQEVLTPDVEHGMAQAITNLGTPWFTEFVNHDPAVDLRKVKVPALALFGERDVQVVPSQNRQPVEAAFQAAGNPNATVKVIPEANHMFQKCKTGGVEEYEQIETTVDPAVLQLVGEWIRANAGKAG